jgi:glucose-6-phosphate dehydrogenase-like protein OpcA
MTSATEALAMTDSFPLTELVKRFAEEWAQQRSRAEDPVTRIASFNLLVVSPHQRVQALEDLLRGLRESHPARVIWIKQDETMKWEEATARLHLCSRSHCTQVCSEQIQIVCGPQPERLASIVLPLIRSGLPTQLLWWKAGPPEGVLFDRLGDRARLILLVKNNWQKLANLLPGLWEDPSRREHAFVPLAWYQILQARQSVAAAYGHSDVTLEFGANSEENAGMSLLQTWIKSTIEGRDSLGGWKGDGITMVETHDNPDLALLKWGEQVQKLTTVSSLEAVRAALNRPRRDKVFARIIDYLRRRNS